MTILELLQKRKFEGVDPRFMARNPEKGPQMFCRHHFFPDRERSISAFGDMMNWEVTQEYMTPEEVESESKRSKPAP